MCAQIHQKWNLYICDDGSTDNTTETVEEFREDSRIYYLKLPHKGVSHARNSGLKRVSSQYVSFLDSDNQWSPEYLSLMIAFMKGFNLDCAYCAARLVGDTDQQWLGDSFSWEACVKQNYIDLNCFTSKIQKEALMFDETLKRFVDWDYILSATKDSRVAYLPSPLVEYCNKQSLKRITTSIHQGSRHVPYLESIRRKHQQQKRVIDNVDSRAKIEECES